jgi:recombination protein RecR
MYPQPIQRLISHFQKLPGIGPKQAARFAFRLLNMDQEELDFFAKDIEQVKKEITICSQCFLTFSKDNNELCQFCRNPNRNQNRICIVETERDALTIEETKAFSGVYHILGKNSFGLGSGSALKPVIKSLISRTKNKDSVVEIIFAMNATPDGQATALWLERLINETALASKNSNIKITRLGRGLSSGIEIEYADKDTLVDAFQNRK